MENITKEPKLEEYGLNASSYENYRNQKRDLVIPEYKYKKSILDYSPFLMLFGFFFGLVFFNVYIVLLGFVLFTVINTYREKQTNKEYSKHQEICSVIKNKIKVIENKLSPFEQACLKYYNDYLEQFFQNNLYKKRSGSEEFEQSLAEFSAIIDEVKEINKKLLFTYIPTYAHESYLENRQINHKYQKDKKPFFSSFNNIKANIDNKEVAIKEIIRPVSPERKYRTARKIDNWDEINKKKALTGLKGEEIVVAIEQEYLESIDRKDLANKVRHVAVELGEGLGYDVLSFFDDGKEKYIEVKSTTSSLKTPYYLSRNELSFLKEHSDDYRLYRILLTENTPEMMVYDSTQILEINEIIPTQYMVKEK